MFIEVGEYSYQFQLLLPPNLPSSFDYELGFGSDRAQINYTMNATVDIPWAVDRQTYLGFTVIGNLDLNMLSPVLKEPCSDTDTKVFCCWWCVSEPVFARFEILKGFI